MAKVKSTKKLFQEYYNNLRKKDKIKAKKYVCNVANIMGTTFHKWLNSNDMEFPEPVNRDIKKHFNL